jgi:hypothetical protein
MARPFSKRRGPGLTKCQFCQRWLTNLNRHLAQSLCNPRNRTAAASEASDSIPNGVAYQVSLPIATGSARGTKRTSSFTSRAVVNQLKNPPMPTDLASTLTTPTNMSYENSHPKTVLHYTPLVFEPEEKEDIENVEANSDDDVIEDTDFLGTPNNDVNSNHSAMTLAQSSGNYTNAGGDASTIVVADVSKVNIDFPIDDPRFTREFSPGMHSLMRIYDVLTHARVPHYLQDRIVRVIGEEVHANEFNPLDPEMKRKAFVEAICKKFPTARPIVNYVALETPYNRDPDNYVRHLRDQVEVITFDFEEQMLDLLADNDIFGDLDNLVVNDGKEEKWLPYENINNTRYEVFDGDFYQVHARMQITDPLTQFCFPWGFYMDRTESTIYQRYGVEPLMAFPLLANLSTRNRKSCSRVIALLPDLDAKSSAVKATNRGRQANKGMSLRNYHRCIEVALTSFKQAQQKGGVRAFLRLGSDVRERVLKIPVAFLLGDAKSQDAATGRYGGHNTNRMCRACKVTYQESNDPYHICEWVESKEFTELVDTILSNDPDITPKQKKSATEALHKMSQHVVRSAFENLDFAGMPYGLFGCTPHDLMHAFLEGVLKYCIKVFIDPMPPIQKTKIDMLVDEIFGKHRSSEKRNMLRTNFTKGMTNLTMVTADEQAGIALTILIIAQMDKGVDVFDNRFDNVSNDTSKEHFDLHALEDNQDANDDPDLEYSSGCSYKDFVEIMECLLAFHAWYKSEVPILWDEDAESQIHKSIRSMFEMIVTRLPRKKGNKWRIQKLHELLHIARDMKYFGSPKNMDTGIWESQLIVKAKIPAESAKKRGNVTFTRQVGERLHVSQCMDKCQRSIGFHGYLNGKVIKNAIEDYARNDDDSITSDQSSITEDEQLVEDNMNPSQTLSVHPAYLIRRNSGGLVKAKWLGRTQVEVPSALVHFFKNEGLLEEISTYKIHTEYFYNGLRYRAHPDYRSEGAWYDWCMVEYVPSVVDNRRERTNKSEDIISAFPPGYYPAKLLGFFWNQTPKKVMAIIHTCDSKISCKDDSCLTEKWKLEYQLKKTGRGTNLNNVTFRKPLLRIVEASCIRDRVYVVEETPGLRESLSGDDQNKEETRNVVLVKDRSNWVQYFT